MFFQFLGVVFIVVAQFFANRFHLFAQIEFALHLLGVFFDLFANLALHLHLIGLFDQRGLQRLHLVRHRRDAQKLNLIDDLALAEEYDLIGKRAGIVQPLHKADDLVRNRGMGLDVTNDVFLKLFVIAFVAVVQLAEGGDTSHQVGLLLHNAEQLDLLHALQEHLVTAFAHRNDAVDFSKGARGV